MSIETCDKIMTKHIKYPEEVRMEAIEAQLNRVAECILKNIVEIDPEISRVIDEHFWELFDNVA